MMPLGGMSGAGARNMRMRAARMQQEVKRRWQEWCAARAMVKGAAGDECARARQCLPPPDLTDAFPPLACSPEIYRHY